jgi:hypothetical protein
MADRKPTTWNGITYTSVTECAESNGISFTAMSRRLKRGYTCDDDMAGIPNDVELLQCKNDGCTTLFEKRNSKRYCSLDCKKASNKRMATESRERNRAESDRISAAITQAGWIYSDEGGLSWTRVLGLGDNK